MHMGREKMVKKFELPHTADSHPHLPVERGTKDLGVGRWVPEQKHTLLAKYVGAARGAMNKIPKRVYLDPFCGPGRIQVVGETMTRDGGALVAARQALSYGVGYTQFLVGDKDPVRADACATRLTTAGAPAQAFHGPAVETVKQMVAKVPSSALVLAYVDPYSLEYLSFEIFKTLAALRKVDILVHYSTMDVLRNIDVERERKRFDAAAPGWQSALQGNNKENERLAFFNYWRSLVQGLGFNFSKEMSLIHNSNDQEIYRLVFFSRHDLPNNLWNDIAKSPTAGLFDNLH